MWANYGRYHRILLLMLMRQQLLCIWWFPIVAGQSDMFAYKLACVDCTGLLSPCCTYLCCSWRAWSHNARTLSVEAVCSIFLFVVYLSFCLYEVSLPHSCNYDSDVLVIICGNSGLVNILGQPMPLWSQMTVHSMLSARVLRINLTSCVQGCTEWRTEQKPIASTTASCTYLFRTFQYGH
jgi:hypothetical protein